MRKTPRNTLADTPRRYLVIGGDPWYQCGAFMKQRVCVRVGYDYRFRFQFYQIPNLNQMNTFTDIIIKIRFLSPIIRIPKQPMPFCCNPEDISEYT